MASEIIQKYRQQWQDMEMPFKAGIVGILIGGAILIFVKSKEHDELVKSAEAAKIAQAMQSNTPNGAASNTGLSLSALPTSVRNQGLEDVQTELERTREDAKRSAEKAAEATAVVQKLNERLLQLENKKSAPTANAVNLEESLPPPVDFSQPAGGSKKSVANSTDVSLPSPYATSPDVKPQEPARPRMKVWPSAPQPVAADKSAAEAPALSIPVNSALESVMLTGINARSNASGGSPAGTVLSANNVGAPFVTRIKGEVIMPNGWKVTDLGDCFVSGSGIAILSSDRANVIANRISCIDKKGVIWEAPLKAYGVDLDGIQGISGKVVTKQGAILAKTFMAGIASGLGTALSPTAIPGYNSNQQSGQQQGIQYANPSLVAQSALGTGFSTAAGQLSKFYLDYAKEMFPVIEVNAGTRVTWILQETVDLIPAWQGRNK